METILANTIYVCMYVCMVPIPKASKDKKLLISYRPIALTSCLLSKLAERLILARLEFVAESRHLIPAEQVGFRAKRSAEDSIGRLVQNVQDGWQRPNKGNRAGQPDGSTAQKYVLVAYDFSRAYDVVDHKLLRLRLLELGLPLCLARWVWGWLRDRRVRVEVQGALSKERIFRAGLPQGSVLSPQLFLLWAAGLAETLRAPGKSPYIYADDTAVLSSGNTMEVATQRAQTAADSLAAWAHQNKMIVAGEKTQLLVFITKRQRHRRMCHQGGRKDGAGVRHAGPARRGDRPQTPVRGPLPPTARTSSPQERPPTSPSRPQLGTGRGRSAYGGQRLRTGRPGTCRRHLAPRRGPTTRGAAGEGDEDGGAHHHWMPPVHTGPRGDSGGPTGLRNREEGGAGRPPSEESPGPVAGRPAAHDRRGLGAGAAVIGEGLADPRPPSDDGGGDLPPIEPVLPPRIPPWTHGGNVSFRLDVGPLRLGATGEERKRAPGLPALHLASVHLASLPQCAIWLWTDGSVEGASRTEAPEPSSSGRMEKRRR